MLRYVPNFLDSPGNVVLIRLTVANVWTTKKRVLSFVDITLRTIRTFSRVPLGIGSRQLLEIAAGVEPAVALLQRASLPFADTIKTWYAASDSNGEDFRFKRKMSANCISSALKLGRPERSRTSTLSRASEFESDVSACSNHRPIKLGRPPESLTPLCAFVARRRVRWTSSPQKWNPRRDSNSL